MKNYNINLIKNVQTDFIAQWIITKANKRIVKADKGK